MVLVQISYRYIQSIYLSEKGLSREIVGKPKETTKRNMEKIDFVSLWENRSLCDVELRTSNNTNIPAHKVVLAAHSPFFRAIFAGASSEMRENRNGCVQMPPDLDDSTLYILLEAVYRGPGRDSPKTLLSNAQVPKILAAASYLSIGMVVHMCCEYLVDTMNVDNVVDIALLADEHGCSELYDESLKYLKVNLGRLLRSDAAAVKSIRALPYGILYDDLLCSGCLCIERDADILGAILVWAGNDESRIEVIPSLVERTETVFYRDDVLFAMKLLESMAENTQHTSQAAVSMIMACILNESRNYMNDSSFYSAIATDEAMKNDYNTLQREIEQGVFESRPTLEWDNQDLRGHSAAGHGCILAAGGLCDGWQSLRSTEIYDVKDDTWRPGPMMPAECSFVGACTLAEEGHVYVSGHSAGISQPSFFRFNTEENEWKVMPDILTQRVNAACINLRKGILVVGGRSVLGRDRHPGRLNERFNTETCTWDTLAPMNHPRASLGLCNLHEKIWAVGGQSLSKTHASMEVFEPERNAWHVCSSTMSQPRKYATVETLSWNQIVVIGGMDQHRRRLSTGEAYDPREGKWRPLPPLPSPRSSASSCNISSDDLYIAGGRIQHDLETSEVLQYSVRSGAWRSCSSMTTARSSLGLSNF